MRALRYGALRTLTSTVRVQVRPLLERRGISRVAATAAHDEVASVTADKLQSPTATPPARLLRPTSNFCRICGSPMRLVQPPTEHEWRHVCSSVACGYTDYFNPRMVVGCIVEHQGKVLLCRRNIEPGRGLWTLPAGYMELNESSAEGAARETLEEAGAVVTITAPYCHWDIPIIGQAYVLFRAQLAPPFSFSAGPESQEVALFSPADIPHAALAFSSIAITLRLYQEDLAAGHFRLHHGVIDKRPGSGPNDPASFVVRDHMALDLQAAEGSAMQPH